MKYRLAIILVLGFVALSFAMNGVRLSSLVKYICFVCAQSETPFRSVGAHVDGSRFLAEKHLRPGAHLHLLTNKEGLSPVMRSRHIALAWSRIPHPVTVGVWDESEGMDAILASDYLTSEVIQVLNFQNFTKVASRGGVTLWVKEAARQNCEILSFSLSSMTHEIMSVVLVTFVFVLIGWRRGWDMGAGALFLFSLLMMIPLACRFRPNFVFVGAVLLLSAMPIFFFRYHRECDAFNFPELSNGQRILSFLLVLLFILGASSLVLSHTFLPPNGLGTCGGRAKLFWTCAGIPTDFWTNPAWQTFQPTYPPGLMLLTLGCYGISGSCGEWFTQMLTVLCASFLSFWLCRKTKSTLSMLLVFAFFASALTLKLATEFYPEVWMGLFVLLGWERVRTNESDFFGWVLIGAAGWFKNEGLIIAVGFWLVTLRLQPFDSFVRRVVCFAFAVTPSLLWHVSCRMCGASLDGFVSVWQVDIGKAWAAFFTIVADLFTTPWKHACVYPLAVLSAFTWMRKNRRLKQLLLFALFCICAWTSIFSLSMAVDFNWHLMAAERLMWLPALLLLRELISQFSNSKIRVISPLLTHPSSLLI